MSVFTKLGQQIAAPVDESGNPRAISPQDFQVWMTEVERVVNAFTSGGGQIFDTRATLFGNLNFPQHTMAWVMQDSTVAYNGVYSKSGASGAGFWTRIADLPYSFIVATDAGAGTPDAIQATSSLPVSGSALVLLNIADTNTGSPVTVSFNGGAALTVKSNSGNDIAVGGLQAGMLVMGRVYGSTFRLVSDQVSSAIIAQVEAFAQQAQAARDEAVAAASALSRFDTMADAAASTPALAPDYVDIAYYNVDHGRGSGGRYKQAASEPTHDAKFQITPISGPAAWYELDEWTINPLMRGAKGDGTAIDRTAIQQAIEYAQLTGAKLYLPPLQYVVDSALVVEEHLTIAGDGMQGDKGRIYLAQYYDPASAMRTPVIKANGNFAAFQLNTHHVDMSGFNIAFRTDLTPTTARVGIKHGTVSDYYQRGAYSRIHDIAIMRAYNGMEVRNAFDWQIFNNVIVGVEGWGMVLDQDLNPGYPNPNNISHSDSGIHHNLIYGTILGAINIRAGGGYRAIDNKLNDAGHPLSVAVLIAPRFNESGPPQVEPLLVGFNSIEGFGQGVIGNRPAGANQIMSQWGIDFNQIWVGNRAIGFLNSAENVKWAQMGSIRGNKCGTNTNGANILELDGVSDVDVTGNTMMTSTGSATGIVWGANSSGYEGKNTRLTNVSAGPLTQPATPASGVPVTNTNKFPVLVSVFGGTSITNVSVNGDQKLAAGGEVVVEPGDSWAWGGTGTPTMKWRRLQK